MPNVTYSDRIDHILDGLAATWQRQTQSPHQSFWGGWYRSPNWLGHSWWLRAFVEDMSDITGVASFAAGWELEVWPTGRLRAALRGSGGHARGVCESRALSHAGATPEEALECLRRELRRALRRWLNRGELP